MSEHKRTVFISYSRENRALATELYRNLRQPGLNVFLDAESIPPGSDFTDAIFNQIARSENFIVLLSPGTLAQSNDSESRLRRELEYAVLTKSQIIPVFVSGFDLKKEVVYLPETLRAALSHVQALQVEPSETITGFIQQLERILKVPDSIKPPLPTPDEWLEAKLEEDDLYTLLYAYVRVFSPTPDLMLYGGEASSEAEIKGMMAETTNTLKESYGIDLTPVVQRVTELVRKRQYDEAIDYIRTRAEKVEQAIEALG